MTAVTTLDIVMPQVGVSVTEATVVAWLVGVGDRVRAGQPVCEIATDKVDFEVVSPANGVIGEILASADDVVAVGQPVARLAGGEVPAAKVPPQAPPAVEHQPAVPVAPPPARPPPSSRCRPSHSCARLSAVPWRAR